MVFLGSWKNRALTISLKPNCLTISLQSRSEAEVYSFDPHGRLWTAMLENISYRRGLNGKTVAKWSSAGQVHHRRWISPEETRGLEDRAHQTAAAIWQAICTGEIPVASAILTEASMAEARKAFEPVLAFDAGRYREDVALYAQVYKPVGILPPDQYMAVVLQLTEGCSFNTCTFCNFYRDRPFRIKTSEQFRQHIQDVLAFLGDGLRLRRTIFLGDANALVTPTARLIPLLDEIDRLVDIEALGGIYAFLDGFSGEKKTHTDWVALRDRGLRRVYVGLESGHDPLLQFLHKPGQAADALQAVQTMKAAGISVGVIVLLGAGGRQYAAAHVRDTIAVLNAMRLDLDDILYFSELIESEGLPYVQDAYRQNLQPLSSADRIQQSEEIEAGLIFTEQSGTPHISRYDIREFIY